MSVCVYARLGVTLCFIAYLRPPFSAYLHSIRDHGLFPGGVSYYPGVAVNAQDTSAVDPTIVAQLAAEADVIVACVGEGTYAEKPGDIDDLALPQVRVTRLVDLLSGEITPYCTCNSKLVC